MKVWKLECILAIIAVLLCVLWLSNPEANLEPLLVLISFVLVLVEIWRRVSSGREKEANVEEKILPISLPDSAIKEETEINSNSMTVANGVFDEIVAGLNVEKYTKLQIEQFAKRNSGKKIEIKVRVSNIESMFKRVDSELILIFTVPQILDSFSMPRFYSATFDRKFEKDLSALATGDIATISGELSFSDLIGDYKVSIKNAQLISFTKS
ncbi:hypothetical protein CGI80_25260 [Vibrio parahaemolyticus]|uniref:hypothetical protein n=1 Tax=Vibrio parahaemolyticus TaxID=670 RepID=UPI00111E53BA|nr:hypothetical protein [Vibrio parahaemolyticus]TOH44697.1 hypothetical protein CGI80_25260 [Vibrio parahaemolyticus]HCE2133866.1 hypothetical protein [Vibrio parahaemolyticus]